MVVIKYKKELNTLQILLILQVVEVEQILSLEINIIHYGLKVGNTKKKWAVKYTFDGVFFKFSWANLNLVENIVVSTRKSCIIYLF